MSSRRCTACATHLGETYVRTPENQFWCIDDADRGRQLVPHAWAGATIHIGDLQFRLTADDPAAAAIERGA